MSKPLTSGNEDSLDRAEARQQVAQLIQQYLDRQERKVPWLVEQTGIHRNTLYRILRAEVLPDASTCRVIAEATEIKAEELLSLAGYMPRPFHSADAATAGFDPQLSDPELGFYLSQIGQMPPETQRIVKTILREEYLKLHQERERPTPGAATEAVVRPFFARPLRKPVTTPAPTTILTTPPAPAPKTVMDGTKGIKGIKGIKGAEMSGTSQRLDPAPRPNQAGTDGAGTDETRPGEKGATAE